MKETNRLRIKVEWTEELEKNERSKDVRNLKIKRAL